LISAQANRLEDDGRLVFFVPHTRPTDRGAIFRELRSLHPDFRGCFRLEAAATQSLSGADSFRTLLVIQRRQRREGGNEEAPPMARSQSQASETRWVHTSVARAWQEKSQRGASGGVRQRNQVDARPPSP